MLVARQTDTMAPVLRARPEWTSTVIPSDHFSWPWYYAMHEMGDAHAAHLVEGDHAAIELRASFTESASLLLPPLALELLAVRLSGSDLVTAHGDRRAAAGSWRPIRAARSEHLRRTRVSVKTVMAWYSRRGAPPASLM